MTLQSKSKICITRLVLASMFFAAASVSAAAQTNTFPSSGNAGIGTTTPSNPLDVSVNQNGYAPAVGINNSSGGASAQAVVSFFEGSTYKAKFAVNSSGASGFVGGSNAFQIWNFMNSPMIFGTNSTERMRIDSGGNVGLGTSNLSPWTQQTSVIESLDTSIFFGLDTDIGINSNAYNQSGWKYKTSDPASNIHMYKGEFYFRQAPAGTAGAPVNWTTPMFINSAGNVGIGTSAPVYSFDVNGGTNSFRAKASTANANDTIATFENSSNITAIFRANGNVGIGNTSPTEKLHVTGNGKFTGNVTVDGSINAKYQDVAEWVPSAEQLPTGTVVVLDPTKSNQVVSSSTTYDTRVAGVISTQPGITLGESGEGKVLVATTGRVRVKVDASRGPIQIGDLLVTSDIAGLAMKSEAVNLGGVQIHRPGTIIGKALEPLAKGRGEILVLLSLQ